MRLITPYTMILSEIDGKKILRMLEIIGRTCYKSEGKITDDSAEKFVANLIKRGHEAMLEHYSFTVKFVVDRGISHEIVRHRLASFAQESTRYCNYTKDDFGNEITFIVPNHLDRYSEEFKTWRKTMENCEKAYFEQLEQGLKPEVARAVLPNSLKTRL